MKNYKYILYIILGASALSFNSCTDEIDYPETKPEIVISEGKSILKFSIAEDKFNFPAEVDSVNIALISRQGSSRCYSAGVKKEDDHFRFSMM
ncbi:MAG: hypothetical protein K2L89_08705, partial [Muribaculaceae bacterium]|nr:hypothetical protein [Muribaculaceae bacterium]